MDKGTQLNEFLEELNTSGIEWAVVKTHLQQQEYNELKQNYSYKEAELLLDTDWNNVIEGRVTESLKKAYITKELHEDKIRLDKAKADLEHYKRSFELAKISIQLTRDKIDLVMNNG